MRLTPKQIEIMQKIAERNLDSSHIDLTQLRQSLSYTASKQAILCSVNHLTERSLIARVGRESRLGSVCTTLEITSTGRALLSNYVPSLQSILVEYESDEITL